MIPGQDEWELHQKGMSLRQIAARRGLDASTVLRRVRRYELAKKTGAGSAAEAAQRTAQAIRRVASSRADLIAAMEEARNVLPGGLDGLKIPLLNLIDLYCSGASLAALSRAAGVSTRVVEGIMAAVQADRGRASSLKVSGETEALILKLVRANTMSVQEIADSVGVHRSVVHIVCASHDLPLPNIWLSLDRSPRAVAEQMPPKMARQMVENMLDRLEMAVGTEVDVAVLAEQWGLTAQQARIANVLMRANGNVVTHDQIATAMEIGGAQEDMSQNNMKVLIHKMRGRLAKIEGAPKIVNVWGVGYKMVWRSGRR
ncbi:MAG: winged helix-turn-helix domain-containing protein [Paracoccus sp. (in: a-proteobacteria)]|nr:winged helix-turn-helix domain-containing protein [Paracoccus sp. (in: a-proteobacteria)]